MDIKQVAAYSNVIENDTLEDIMYENMRHFVPIGYTEEELAYARRFQEVITELDKEGLKDLISILSGRDKEKKRQMEESQKALEEKEFTAAAGGGAVEVTVSGKREITKVKLAEEVVDPDDIEMLEDLIVAATNEALRKVEEESAAVMSKLTGGLGSLGGGLPF